MDHIPLPTQNCRPHPEIDYICSRDFSLAKFPSFQTYPERYGFDPAALVQSMDFSPLEEKEADSLMQEWLFFILLADVFRIVGIVLKLDDFIRPGEARYDGEPARKVVITEHLYRYLQEWHRIERSTLERASAQIETRARGIEVLKLLKHAQGANDNLLREGNKYIHVGPFGFWLISLLETLHHTAHLIYAPVLSPQESLNLTLYIPPAPWLARRMLGHGWCPNEIGRLHHLLSNSGVYFASSMQLPDESRSFHHSRCDEYQCQIDNIDRDTYESKHRCQSGSCPHIGPDMREVNALLSTGKIPVVRSKSCTPADRLASVELEVTSFDLVPYTAISHVWSDGRGNLAANTLPECQILHLSALVQDLSPKSIAPYFWIDTLCCPVQPSLRRTAIRLMRRTYEDAAQVLVLDYSLESVSAAADPEDLLIRVTRAGWMRRLWTLQEGALARRLFIQFGERAVEVEAMRKTIQDAVESDLGSPLAAEALACCDSFQKFKNLRTSGILELIRALQWRTTSWKQDETICLSILLDLDVDKITGTDAEERMSTFFHMLEEFPFQLAFLSGPRLQQKNITWAPTSLMPPRGTNLPNESEVVRAKQFPIGLFVQNQAIWLEDCPAAEQFWVRIRGDSGRYLVQNSSLVQDSGPSWTVKGPGAVQDPAIIPSGVLWTGLDADDGMMVDVAYFDERTPGQWVGKCNFFSRLQIRRYVHEDEWTRMESMISLPDGSGTTSPIQVLDAERTEKGTWCIQ